MTDAANAGFAVGAFDITLVAAFYAAMPGCDPDRVGARYGQSRVTTSASAPHIRERQ